MDSVGRLNTDLDSIKHTIQEDSNDRKTLLDNVAELIDEVKASRQEARSLRPLETPSLQILTYPDPRVVIEPFTDKPELGKFCELPVIFKKIGIPTNANRLIRVYEKIGHIARVQKLHAVVEFRDARYALLQNVGPNRSVAQVVNSQTLDEYTFKQRLSFAYELAATVSTIHSADLLIKVISDTSVKIDSTPDGGIYPLLSELDQAREV